MLVHITLRAIRDYALRPCPRQPDRRFPGSVAAPIRDSREGFWDRAVPQCPGPHQLLSMVVERDLGSRLWNP